MPGGKNQCFPHPSICPAAERMIHYSARARLDCSGSNNHLTIGNCFLSVNALSSLSMSILTPITPWSFLIIGVYLKALWIGFRFSLSCKNHITSLRCILLDACWSTDLHDSFDDNINLFSCWPWSLSCTLLLLCCVVLLKLSKCKLLSNI